MRTQFQDTYRMSFSAVKPTFGDFGRVHSVQLGGRVALHCNVQGFPLPIVTWWKQGRRIANGSVLEISSASRVHNGTYVCKAGSEAGQVSTDVSLLVTGMAGQKKISL